MSILVALVCCWTACRDDVTSAGSGVLDKDDAIVVYVDTFPLASMIDSCKAIVSQADSFLLGEMETDYGTLRGSVLTQLACPDGYSYPKNAEVDSMFLFVYYDSWTGDPNAALAVDAYQIDNATFNYSTVYPTDLNIDDYCTREKPILTNRRIVVATEKLDSIKNSDGVYIPMLKMRVNEEFQNYFWSIRSFENQDTFNKQFMGLLLESSFGSSTMLNISTIALGVYYHFSYSKAGRDTTVNDMKAFYANSEVRTVNQLTYEDKHLTIENLKKDSDTYNYIISPACAYTRLTNVYKGSESQKQRNDWLQPASYMLLIKESSMERFFANKELPSDTCALLSPLIQGKDATGESIYYYNYDLSDFITNQLRQDTHIDQLQMMLVPVSLNAVSGNAVTNYSSVRQQETMSVTQIESAKNGTDFEIVYSGFTLPVEH